MLNIRSKIWRRTQSLQIWFSMGKSFHKAIILKISRNLSRLTLLNLEYYQNLSVCYYDIFNILPHFYRSIILNRVVCLTLTNDCSTQILPGLHLKSSDTTWLCFQWFQSDIYLFGNTQFSNFFLEICICIKIYNWVNDEFV